MDFSNIPEDIRYFILEHIESVSQLDVLLYFYQNKEHEFTPHQISREQRSNDTTAARQMVKLAQLDILNNIKNSPSFTYNSENKYNDVIVKLSDFYAEFQVAVISLIYDKPTDKLKGFADAFKFKKD